MERRRATRRARRTAFTAAALTAWALGTAPALAELPVGPDVTVPTPIQHGTEHSSTTTTTAPPPTTTTTAPTTTTTAAVPRAQVPVGSASTETSTPSVGATATATASEVGNVARRPGSPARRSSTRARTSPGGVETFDVAPASADDAPAIARLRQVTLPAARQFGFPLGLAALVLAFLALQGRLDARDPKLAAAPLSVDDDLLPFA